MSHDQRHRCLSCFRDMDGPCSSWNGRHRVCWLSWLDSHLHGIHKREARRRDMYTFDWPTETPSLGQVMEMAGGTSC